MLKSPASSRGSSPTLRLALLFGLLVVAVYADPLFFRRNFAGRDLLGYGLPNEFVIHDAYSRGRLPVWNSDIAGGRPLLANPNAGALYPMRPLLSLLPFPLAFRFFPLLHWALAGAGMISLLRALGVSAGGAWIGAVTYVFSGVEVSEVFYNNNHPGVMLLPWILWAVAREWRKPSTRTLVLSILLGLAFLAGDPFAIGIALSASLLWIFLEVPSSQRTRRVVSLAVAFGLALLFAFPQILATFLWIPETNRAVLGMRLSEVFTYSISPFRLLELVVPFPFGATWAIENRAIWGWPVFHGRSVGFFSTLYPGAIALIALVAMRSARAKGNRFARVLFLAGLAVTIPGSLLPAGWGELASPLPLRFPEKFAVSLALAVALAAGLFFDAFRRSPARLRWTLAVGAALALAALGISLYPAGSGWLAASLVGDPRYAATAAAFLPGALAEGGLLWMATVISIELVRRGTPRSLGVSLALLTLVPVAANRRIASSFREDRVFAPTPFARFISRADPHGSFRAMGAENYRPPSALETAQLENDVAQLEYSRRNWDQYTQCLWRRGSVFNTDFDSGDLSRLESLRRVSFVAAGYRDSQAFFGALALRWGIRFHDQAPLPGFHRVGGDALMDWDEHERAYPDLRLLTGWREETGALPALESVGRLSPGELVIESGERRQGRARPGRLRVLEKSPERLVLETDAPDPTWLFALRGYWSSRTVLLDRKPVEVSPAQLAFSAIPVPAGRHSIEWREEVPGWRIGRWGPLLFVLAAGWLIAAGRRVETS